jgi:hypothetical protein
LINVIMFGLIFALLVGFTVALWMFNPVFSAMWVVFFLIPKLAGR